MSWAPVSPVVGASVTGLASPTYTILTDVAPNINGKQYAVSALGGTQTNVEVNSVSKPFTLAFFRPPVLRTLPQANPVTGVIKNVPLNVYKQVVRKGAAPAANQSIMVPRCTIVFEVPAGTDTYEPEDLRAMVSLSAGLFWAQADGIAQTLLTGVL